jgi:hypothetical protein
MLYRRNRSREEKQLSRLDELKKEILELEAKANAQEGQQNGEVAAIPADDPEVLPLMERVEGEEYLLYWPEYKNRTLDEAKEIVYLRRVIRDASRSRTERWEAENALMAIRRKLQGANDNRG